MASAASSPHTSPRGVGLVQVLLVLVVIVVITMLGLELYKRSGPPAVGGGATHPARAVLDRVTLRVEGLNSDVDALLVTEALRRVAGVASASVEFRTGEAQVTFNPSQTNPDELIAAVARTGFRARR